MGDKGIAAGIDDSWLKLRDEGRSRVQAQSMVLFSPGAFLLSSDSTEVIYSSFLSIYI